MISYLGYLYLAFWFKYELIYQIYSIEYLLVYFQLDMFRAYTPNLHCSATHHQHTHSSGSTPRHTKEPYAAYVKKL